MKPPRAACVYARVSAVAICYFTAETMSMNPATTIRSALMGALLLALPTRRSAPKVTLRGEVAWVTSTSLTQGVFEQRPVNLSGG